jgi:short-chain Z-isoprenyl diphosphate synthase
MLKRGNPVRRAVARAVYGLYERQVEKQLRGAKLPQHIAVLCDGNRRWARANGFADVSHGHRVGALKIAEFLSWCDAEGVGHATVWLLSTENLRRDAEELAALLDVIHEVVAELCAPDKNWQVQIVGALELLPEEFATNLVHSAKQTVGRTGNHVNVAVGYGGRQEISDAVRSLVAEKLSEGLADKELVESIDVAGIGEHLYTSGQPDPDLVIRTSGEQRLSGFLLWQSVHSEIWFTEAYWPEFRRVDFLRALRDYAARHRRFGV